MNNCSTWFVRLAALAALVALTACANKGATSLDDDANRPAEDRAGAGSGNRCGNGVIDKNEECDGADLDGVTCMNLGFEGGRLDCDPMICTFETAGCTRPPPVPMGGSGG